ncbi:MAG: hypothetical protein ABIH10_01780 [Spirochaetota bacterium]
MIKFSQKQALVRWDTLPYNLRAAIFSDYNAEILWCVCENQHLTEDKIQKIATLVGGVLMGFVHSEDFASEVREALDINIEIADAIAAEINKKIFSQFKNDLERIYQPVSSEMENIGEEGESPVLDLRKKIEEPDFKIIEDESQEQENKIDLSKEIKKEEVAPSQAEPVMEKKEEGKTEEPKVESASVSFETPAPAATVEPLKEEGPLIIHQEVGFKPISGKLKSLGGMFNFLRGKDEFKKENEPVKAELEIGEEIKAMKDTSVQGTRLPDGQESSSEVNAPLERAFGGKNEYKPQIIKEEPILDKKVSETVKVVNYSEMPEQPITEKFEVVKIPAEPAIETAPKNLPATREDLEEIKPEAEPEKKVEEKKPEAGKSEESEEMINLEDFK